MEPARGRDKTRELAGDPQGACVLDEAVGLGGRAVCLEFQATDPEA